MTYNIQEADFRTSASDLSQMEPPLVPEVAFVGRSNVGKSSLLNLLFQRKKLAKVSNTPGRTRLINIFDVVLQNKDETQNEVREFVWVDLPGYGYAKMSKALKGEISDMLVDYLGGRQGLYTVCQLFDLRHQPTAEDKQVFAALQARGLEVIAVATKADKLALSKRKPARIKLAKALGLTLANVVLTSSEGYIGRQELIAKIWKASVA
jgi:GTP-binding protein